jgi:endonuclease III
MKHGAAQAAKIRKLFRELKNVEPKPTWPESDDPLEQLMLAVLSEGTHPAKARSALNRLLAQAVDLNELRVSTPQELALNIEGLLPNPLERTTALVQVLQSLYERENGVTLERLKGKGKRETRAYLETLEGITPYVVACTMLWGLGDHAIAVDEALLAQLKKEELVDATADAAAVQQFLERHIPSNEAKLFTLVMKRYAAQRGVRVRTARKPGKLSQVQGSDS